MKPGSNGVLIAAIAILAILNLFTLGMGSMSAARISALEAQQRTSIDTLRSAQAQVLQQVQDQSAYDAAQRQLIENQTRDNFAKLQDYVTQKTTTLQLDLQNQINDSRGASAAPNDQSRDFSTIVEEVQPAVVTVRTDFGLGSGFFFDKSGYVMTNRHVIQGASTIMVIDNDSNMHAAKLVGVARNADLAVLKVTDGTTFAALDFAPSTKVGERVIALGSPLGLSDTVTEGIVSATDRQIDGTGVGYVQTDVAINHGNSGGPLVDAKGEVVGINTLGLAYSTGLGFAVPASVAKTVAQNAINAG